MTPAQPQKEKKPTPLEVDVAAYMDWRCKHCGCPVGLWAFGWKHHAGGKRKGCGRKLKNTDVIEGAKP